MNSILASIKKLLGIASADTNFDQDIIIHINSVLSILTQLGVGPASGFFISSDTDTWSDFIGESINVELIKSYVYMKVRLIFDPPISGTVTESYNKMISELEWRINTLSETEGITNNELENLKADIDDLTDKADEHDDLFEILVGDQNA